MPRLRRRASVDDTARRLMTIPGVGPITAAAIRRFAPPMETFSKGRDFAAWIGLTPRQHSSGGKERLGRTSKMGQRDLRRLLIIGAWLLYVGPRNEVPQKALGSPGCWRANHICWLRWHWPTRWRGSPGHLWHRGGIYRAPARPHKVHERCEAVEDVSRSKEVWANGQRDGIGRTRPCADERLSSARKRTGPNPRISIQARGA